MIMTPQHHAPSANLRPRSLTLSAGLLSLTLAAFAPQAAAQDGTVVVASAFDIETFDPSREWSGTSLMVFHMVYDTLTAYSADGSQLVPLLAESWTASNNNATFTFNLDADAVFSDGSPVEAKDVIFSLERAKNVGIAGFLYEDIEEMTEVSLTTVEITLSESNSEFPALLASSISAILNSDVAMEQGATTDPATDEGESWLIANSAGSGPFVLESYDPGNAIILARNESFWRDKPAFGRFVMQNVQDPASQALLLETGGADIALGLDGASAGTITTDGVRIERAPSADAIYLVLGPGTEEAAGQLSPHVRQAIVHAIDFQGLIDDLAEG
ncbi:MAG: ABC transporter substrate-binding protein, partial [Hyphomonas sp.]|nr:ABC transporter substrate-binding protein [Hyphomonas sp.]